MAGHVVRSPDGRQWIVRRLWTKRLGRETLRGRIRRLGRKTRDTVGDGLEADPGCLLSPFENLPAIVVIVIGVLLLWFVVLPLLFVLLDLLLILLLAGLGVLGRVLLGRPWRIEALAEDGTAHHWDVVGWDASRAKVDEVATALASGIVPPADAV